jgi:hypothetical protein
LDVVAAGTEIAKDLARDFYCDVASLLGAKTDFEVAETRAERRRDFFDIVASSEVDDVRGVNGQRKAEIFESLCRLIEQAVERPKRVVA